jgi:hypothetical protein
MNKVSRRRQPTRSAPLPTAADRPHFVTKTRGFRPKLCVRACVRALGWAHTRGFSTTCSHGGTSKLARSSRSSGSCSWGGSFSSSPSRRSAAGQGEPCRASGALPPGRQLPSRGSIRRNCPRWLVAPRHTTSRPHPSSAACAGKPAEVPSPGRRGGDLWRSAAVSTVTRGMRWRLVGCQQPVSQ